MKELLLQFARYNVWANKRIIAVLLKLDEELLDKEVRSSFPTLRATVYHMWSVEFIWLQRMQLVEQPVWIMDIFKGDFITACTEWEKVAEALVAFIEKQYDDKAFEHVFEFMRAKKSFKSPVRTTLLHVFNHATYHRGQLVTMLRELGLTKIPELDITAFAKK